MTCCPNGSTPKDKPRSLSMFGFDNLVQYSSKKKTAAKKKSVNINANVDFAGQSEGVDHRLTMPH